MTERELDDLMKSMKEHHEWQLEQWRKEREEEIWGGCLNDQAKNS